MDSGGPVQALGVAPSGLASRRGSQNPKPLSVDALRFPNSAKDNSVPTPRTSRSHLLAGLRTAPKSATATSFFSNNNAQSPTSSMMPQNVSGNRNTATTSLYNDSFMNGPKTAAPQYFSSQSHQHAQQYAPSAYLPFQQQYTPDQILAPSEIRIDQLCQDQMDPNFHAQLLAANAYLSQQKQVLQQQLMNLQAATQQLQGMNINDQLQRQQNQQSMQGISHMNNNYQVGGPYAQQSQHQQQPNLGSTHQFASRNVTSQPRLYVSYDPMTGQPTYYIDQSSQMSQQQQVMSFMPDVNNSYGGHGYASPQAQAQTGTPRVQVSPPPLDHPTGAYTATASVLSPPEHESSAVDEHPSPLPPPSANAFRRSHKKSTSLSKSHFSIPTDDVPRSPGPKTASFLIGSSSSTSYGPGQARAGEHPIRQPRGPPSFDQLVAKPTSKHEGSKNFATRTRRSAVHNLVRAGLKRRKDGRSTSSGSGSNSPRSSVCADEVAETPTTTSASGANDGDSVRSGSGSLVGDDDARCSAPSSRTSWGAIGSDRPSSRRNVSRSGSSNASSDGECARAGSFASLLKGRHAGNDKPVKPDAQRKAPMLVLTNAEKRKNGIPMAVA